MTKTFAEIESIIGSDGNKFHDYIGKFLHAEVLGLVESLMKHTHVYLYNGLINNFFLRKQLPQKSNILFDGYLNLFKFLEPYDFEVNETGGYHVNIAGEEVNLWCIKELWSVKMNQPEIEGMLAHHIPHISLFNLSSIIYSFNKKKFYYTREYIQFLRTKELDFRYENQDCNPLAIVFTFYYVDQYKIKIGLRLKSYLKIIYPECLKECDRFQMDYFGKILYPQFELKRRIENL